MGTTRFTKKEHEWIGDVAITYGVTEGQFDKITIKQSVTLFNAKMRGHEAVIVGTNGEWCMAVFLTTMNDFDGSDYKDFIKVKENTDIKDEIYRTLYTEGYILED